MSDVIEQYFRCGSCRHFEVAFTDSMNRTMGQCFTKPRHATGAAHDYACQEYLLDRDRLVPGATVPPDAELSPRERKRRDILSQARERAMADNRRGNRRPRQPRQFDEETPRERITEIPLGLQEGDMDRDELKGLLSEVIDEALGLSSPPMAPRFRGGKVIVQPANPELQAKEIDIDVLFRKITSIRDKLRVLEQKLNNQERLEVDEKAQMQGYITAAYGSLTTFNFLFRDREDSFSSKG